MTALYVPGTSEKDPSKVIMSLQNVAAATTTNTTNVATNTAAIAALNAATYVNSLNAKTGALTLSVVPRVFTASGTYTPTSGMVYCIIECVGGGGSGGSVAFVASNFTTGSGGGGGAYSRKIATAATVGTSQVVTVGAGGTAPASGQNNGNAGAQSSVGTLCTAPGGAGGPYAKAAVQVSGGGAGGAAGTGDISIPGGDGGGGLGSTSANGLFSGFGGSSIFANSKGVPATSSNGATGNHYGGGGSGAQDASGTTNFAGGAGGAGVVFITEYVLA